MSSLKIIVSGLVCASKLEQDQVQAFLVDSLVNFARSRGFIVQADDVSFAFQEQPKEVGNLTLNHLVVTTDGIRIRGNFTETTEKGLIALDCVQTAHVSSAQV